MKRTLKAKIPRGSTTRASGQKAMGSRQGIASTGPRQGWEQAAARNPIDSQPKLPVKIGALE
jgi:hypothetical protein